MCYQNLRSDNAVTLQYDKLNYIHHQYLHSDSATRTKTSENVNRYVIQSSITTKLQF